MEDLQYLVEAKDEGMRLDVYLSQNLEDLSRSYIKKLLDSELVSVNGHKKKPSYKVQDGDEIMMELPDVEPLEVEPKDIPITIIYEDEDLVVVDKAKGMVVHPGKGNLHDTLVNALLFHVDNLSGINGVLRPGIVHRIDKDTTGVIVVAKNDRAHQYLSAQLKDHTMEREYYALVHGNVKRDKGTIEGSLGRSKKDRLKMAITEDGKRAVTHYQVIRRYKGYTLIKAILETGRTHQIRVHMASIHHPVVGDFIYGHKKDQIKGQLLHAAKLGFMTPEGKKLVFRAPVHEEFKTMLVKLHRMGYS